jgi:hypothetical protein
MIKKYTEGKSDDNFLWRYELDDGTIIELIPMKLEELLYPELSKLPDYDDGIPEVRTVSNDEVEVNTDPFLEE